jgi:2-polyprenyl-6-hydroxyphenyl methylase/3-demethylubiquinone-9 3-methyltransferase
MKTAINPVRVGYAKRKLLDELRINPVGKLALEIGCGGGILCEEIARMGFTTIGIDPSEPSLQVARSHANMSGLSIRYDTGAGEALPYQDDSCDLVFCCDVLEHVSDLAQVISEINRVLKPAGVFLYDTINRTLLSKLIVIHIMQTWKQWALMPQNFHVWEKFIKPRELQALLLRHNLEWREHRGITIQGSIPRILMYLHKRAKGEWNYRQLADKLLLVESRLKSVMYMGYAVKA